ncbi:MAG: hypothetical protein WCW54_03345 [Candidatus Paceibacterota bacterium]
MSNEKISRGEKKRIKNLDEQEKKLEDVNLSDPDGDKKIIPTEDFFSREIEKIKSNKDISDKEKERLEKLATEKEEKKKEITSQLRKTPIVQYACDRTGTGRSTYYKWRADDLIFARAADRAIQAGCFLINDLAESKLLGLIQESHPTAIIYWLKHNHPKYAEVNRIIHQYEVLTNNKPSVEEENIADQEMAKIIGSRMMPTMTKEEAHIGGMRLKQEEEEDERNVKQNERLRSFEEEL